MLTLFKKGALFKMEQQLNMDHKPWLEVTYGLDVRW